eukprot:TRINITY_DN5858_c0_g1_i1.p5 TRINITY_DN5858_c0_g1~~TRINITY_DN5858_c0_g1_i1.p5  ORF type:complete len:127 (+),score=0.35 TRINITY_DN5858_c0_g1_i1:446-826(+)
MYILTSQLQHNNLPKNKCLMNSTATLLPIFKKEPKNTLKKNNNPKNMHFMEKFQGHFHVFGFLGDEGSKSQLQLYANKFIAIYRSFHVKKKQSIIILNYISGFKFQQQQNYKYRYVCRLNLKTFLK